MSSPTAAPGLRPTRGSGEPTGAFAGYRIGGALASDTSPVMVLPLGPHAGPQQIVRLRKTGEGLAREELIAVRFVPLLPGQAKEL